MDWTTGLSWLSTLKSGPDEHGPDVDHGDMGTAFGLDASMSPIGADAFDPVRSGAQEPWERRIVRRSAL